tara:strand:+ start:491 stop:955 length:465 start_codon:yes stop_codon:yes gene_type:complete
MGEYSGVNRANSQYLYGLIILITLAMWVPNLALTRDYTLPLISLIAIVISPFIVATILLMFAKMSITVDDAKIRLVFWWGFPKKEILINDIRAVELHELSYWWGTGVQMVRQGSIWRAWGKTTVLVKQSNGKSVTIGSDNPDELLQAIRSRLNH